MHVMCEANIISLGTKVILALTRLRNGNGMGSVTCEIPGRVRGMYKHLHEAVRPLSLSISTLLTSTLVALHYDMDTLVLFVTHK